MARRLFPYILILSAVQCAAAGESVGETKAIDLPEFSAQQRSLIESLSLRSWPDDSVLRPDGNAVRERNDAAKLGQLVFFDARFSDSGEVSCASCHQPERSFSDGVAVAVGSGLGSRNTPTLVGVSLNKWFFADGRRDSAWSQALSPIETSHEMNNNRLAMLRDFFADGEYRETYIKIFGEQVPGSELLNRVEAASPMSESAAVRDAWQRFSPSEQHTLNTHFANLGKVLAAFQHKLKPPKTAFDEFVDSLVTEGEAAARKKLSEDALQGLAFFIDRRNQCIKCHQGPALSDGEFHNIGTGYKASGALDSGRAEGQKLLAEDPFNCSGEFNSGAKRICEASDMFGSMGANIVPVGAFRTPTLRQLSHTGPYFHDGRAKTLNEIFEHYRKPPKGYGHLHELWPEKRLEQVTQRQLAAFLESLSGEIPIENNWYLPPESEP